MSASTSAAPLASTFVTKYASQIADKTILITGVSPGGLGAFFVDFLLTAPTPPKRIILAGRSLDKLQATQAKVEAAGNVESKLLVLDLGSFASVRKAAEEVNAWDEGVDVLINNAGIMGVPYAKTEDGHESQLQANHLGHFLFTGLIIDQILKRKGRVVNVSSNGYRWGPVRFNDYDFLTYDAWTAYGQSKTIQILHAHELARRLGDKGLEVFAIHPTVYMTGLSTHGADIEAMIKTDRYQGHGQYFDKFSFAANADEAVATHFYAAFDPELKAHNGTYIEDCKPVAEEDLYAWARGDVESKKAWALSEKLVGQTFDF